MVAPSFILTLSPEAVPVRSEATLQVSYGGQVKRLSVVVSEPGQAVHGAGAGGAPPGTRRTAAS